ncbi:hypothetical protein B0H13DRAFT_1935216 [Mycena leptocephala]|nr:hypothetical protein B0H13DRAFT_1935216 [Mycena leptocephala]
MVRLDFFHRPGRWADITQVERLCCDRAFANGGDRSRHLAGARASVARPLAAAACAVARAALSANASVFGPITRIAPCTALDEVTILIQNERVFTSIAGKDLLRDMRDGAIGLGRERLFNNNKPNHAHPNAIRDICAIKTITRSLPGITTINYDKGMNLDAKGPASLDKRPPAARFKLHPISHGFKSPSSFAGTLRSGKEFAIHGAIVLQDFDVLEHLQTARAKTNDADNASDDHPVSVPPATSRSDQRSSSVTASRSRSQSPPRRSARLAAPVDDSVDRTGRTRAAHRADEQRGSGPLSSELFGGITSPDDYPVTSTGWSAIRKKNSEQREYTIDELKENFGMSVIEWDDSTSCPLVDKESRIIAVLGGRPNDPKYLRLTQEVARQLEEVHGQLKLRPDQVDGRRGAFSSVSAGISFGGGQQIRNLALPVATAIIFGDAVSTSRDPFFPAVFREFRNVCIGIVKLPVCKASDRRCALSLFGDAISASSWITKTSSDKTQPVKHPGRNKFEPLRDRPEMPPTIPVWEVALKNVDRTQHPLRSPCPIDLCYVLPEPALLALPDALGHRQLRLYHFTMLHNALLYRIAHAAANQLLLKSQEWRNILVGKSKGLRIYGAHQATPYNVQLAKPMCAWPGAPSVVCKAGVERAWPDAEMRQLEKTVASFYCQEFYEYFGHAAVIPMRIEHEFGM